MNKSEQLNLNRIENDATNQMAKTMLHGVRNLRHEIAHASANPKIGTSADERERLQKNIRSRLAELERGLSNHIRVLTASAAKLAHDAATAELEAAGKNKLVQYDPARTERYLSLLAPGNANKFTATYTNRLNEEIARRLQIAFVENARQGHVEGWTAQHTAKEFRNRLAELSNDKQAFKFIDRGGREWDNKDYAQIAVRTAASRVHRESQIDTAVENKIKYKRISDDYPTNCKICAVWQGRILVVDGSDGGDYPTYAEALDAGMFHPNCMHDLEYIDEEDDAEEFNLQAEHPPPDDLEDLDAMQANMDELDAARYVAEGMTQEEAELEVVRDKLEASLLGGLDISREKAEELAAGFSDDEIRDFQENGIPKFETCKKGDEPHFNDGSAGGVVYLDRNKITAGEIHRLVIFEVNNESFNTDGAEQQKDEIKRGKEAQPTPPKLTPLEKSIQKARAEIVTKKHEVLVALDDNGNEIMQRIDGSKTRVTGTINTELATGKTFLHNHPDDKKDLPGFSSSFSKTDIHTAAQLNLKKMIVVTPRRDYEMRPGSDGWPSKTKITREYNKAFNEVKIKLQQKIATKKITPQQANSLWAHIAWKQVANNTGMEYIVQRHQQP